MKTFMFPGQGSQAKGMGGDLFDRFTDLTDKADKVLGYSIKELCIEDPRDELGQTQFTQPALYVVNALSYYDRVDADGKKPDYAIGHSLGEFNALLVAGCFDFEAGLKLVKKRAELMSQATDGGMAAILNADKEEIESILAENELENIDLVNFNTPSQIVISGLKEEIERARQCFQKGRIRYLPLNTSGAFHSRFMKPAKQKFETYLKKFKLSNPTIPVISNVTARPYEHDRIVETLSSQIASPVRWYESVEYLASFAQMEFEELGHGRVLTGLVDKIMAESSNIETADAPGDAPVETDAEKTSQAAVKTQAEQTDHGDPATTTQSSIPAEQKVREWNERHPVGTKVESTVFDYGQLETRTEAVVLFGHRAAVYMKGYNGYFDLDEIAARGG